METMPAQCSTTVLRLPLRFMHPSGKVKPDPWSASRALVMQVLLGQEGAQLQLGEVRKGRRLAAVEAVGVVAEGSFTLPASSPPVPELTTPCRLNEQDNSIPGDTGEETMFENKI